MNESQEKFCQRLLAADPATPEFKSKYEKELHMLFSDERRVRRSKHKLVVATILSFATAIAAVLLLALPPNAYFDAPLPRRVLIVIAIFMFIMGIYSVRLWIRGKNMEIHGSPLENLGWTMNLLVFGIFAFNAFAGGPGSLALLGFGVGILVFSGVQKIVQDVKRAELRTREKLLRLEFQFAELTEKLQPKRD